MGNISGYPSLDSISLFEDLNYEKINRVSNMTMIFVDKEEGFNYMLADGVVGLGLESKNIQLNDTNRSLIQNNLINEYYKQGLISLPRFSLYLSSTPRVDSKLYIGDFSKATLLSPLYQQMVYCDTPKKFKQWGCQMDYIEVNKTKYNLNSNAYIDSGSTYLTIPVGDFKFIKNYVLDSATENDSDCKLSESGQILCKCSSPYIFPNITLFLDSSPFTIITSEIIDYFPNLAYQCRFEAFVDLNNFYTWTLGITAIKNALFSFDITNRRIGFVQSAKEMNNLINKDNILIEPSDNVDSKLGYFFALIFIIIIIFGLMKFSTSENNRSDSFNYGNLEDKQKIELIKNKFNTDEYDYDDVNKINLNINHNKKDEKLLEMKDIEK